MANKSRSDSDVALIERRTLSVKAKRQHPFILKSFLSNAGGEGLKRNMEGMK